MLSTLVVISLRDGWADLEANQACPVVDAGKSDGKIRKRIK